MTVKELIEKLKSCDENAEVRMTYWVDGENGDSGCDAHSDVNDVRETEMADRTYTPRAPQKRKMVKVVTLH